MILKILKRSLSNILVLNCGSSSIKYKVINLINKSLIYKGNFESLKNEKDYNNSLQRIFHQIEEKEVILTAIGHRWVNGGLHFKKTIIVNDQIIQQLENILSLAPYVFNTLSSPLFFLLHPSSSPLNYFNSIDFLSFYC